MDRGIKRAKGIFEERGERGREEGGKIKTDMR